LPEIFMYFRELQSMMTEQHVFEIDKDIFRKNLIKYTRKAFLMLPKLENPRILDIGCGSGVPTIELARLCNGQIVGVDINRTLLDKLVQKIKKEGVSDRVRTLKCSLFELDFPDESFDIIWSEGSIFTIGFGRGLQEWERFLKPTGFLVIHDELKNMTEKWEQISRSGFFMIGHFELPGDTWWKEYYMPLEEYLKKIRIGYSDPAVLSVCDTEQQEIDMFKKNPNQYGSVFFIMQKKWNITSEVP
jgi:ubiquinone/menaquinone biosynthesis C-methylase UbiE